MAGVCKHNQYFSQQTMDSKVTKATSYRDLLRNFQQAESVQPTPRERKPAARPLQLKKTTHRENKENFVSKSHMQSVQEKSTTFQNSQWIEEQVLREHNHKRKDRQLQHSYNKFIAYVTGVLSKLTGSVPPDLLLSKLAYLQYLAALKEMAFIKETYEPTPNDSVTELWNELYVHGQTIGSFIMLVAGILRMRKPEEERNQKYEHLWAKYGELRYTRMEQIGKVRTTVDCDEDFPFSPIISQRSRTLAASRSKSKGKFDKCLAQKSYNQLMEDSSDNNNSSQSRELMNSKVGSRRSEILYKMAKEKSLEKRTDKKSAEIQYEKSINELTFHPKIHPNLKEKPKKQLIQGEQDSINRMIRGRVQRQVRKIIQQKGLPYNQKMFQKMKKERYDAIMKAKTINLFEIIQDHPAEPTKKDSEQSQQLIVEKDEKKIEKTSKKHPLVLSIQVDEGRCEKLVIQDGECYKQAAAKFIKDLKLSQEMYEKLVDGVQHALKFQLAQIDEDSFESQYESVE